ncbi:hypothetical protein AWN90_17195 [Nocardia terpenica]|uniref:Mce/MlaD domain-containing protein n=1 Tax=Nocardia terpenica TaxID=455432 RepID=A0A161Z7C1_9NOCA|nr:hypothetical protein AWN90_17195 [Nocardia terpenica]
MLTVYRLLASRGLLSAVVAGLAALIAFGGYAIVADPRQPMLHYCARMPDAVGLYPGTHVRVRGVAVGTITAIRPESPTVRVDFDIDAKYPLHGDVSAVTVAPTLAADRDLAVLPGPSSAARWSPAHCITRTLTPKSITETLRAVDTLARRLNSDDDPQLLRDTIDSLRTATAGTGAQANRLITTLGSVLRTPDTAVTQVGQLIDALGSLAATISANWAELQQVLTRFPDVFHQINDEIFSNITGLVDSLRIILPWADDLTHRYGGAILGGLDAAVPYMRLIAADADSLQQIVARFPALATAFTRATAPDGKPVLTWAPPKLALPRPAADQVCAAVNAIVPGRCTGDPATTDMTTLIFGSAGAR